MSLYVRYPSNGASSGGGGGGGTGIQQVTLYDPVDTTLPTSAPLTIDGVLVVTGTTVLFSNLSTGNNEIYAATVVGSSVSWVAQSVFNGSVTPTSGAQVIVTSGTSFADQTGVFNGTTWLFNYAVRYFNGVNYFEQSSLYTSALVDNTVNGTVFSLAYAGSQNILVDFSIIRSGVKEIGTIALTTDGSVVAISTNGSATGLTGVTFSAIISGINLILQYTTTSTGSDATMQYSIKRWSDTAGGPGGPPSYSGGGSSGAPGGPNNSIQYNNAGNFGGSSNFSLDTSNNLLELGNLQLGILQSSTLLDNQASPVAAASISATYSAVVVEYSVSRGTNFRTGRFLLANDGTNVSSSEDFVEQGTTGITFTASLSAGNVNINYTSSSTGMNATFKYAFRRWMA